MLSIGTVIEVDNIKAMIVGYVNQVFGENVRICYTVAPWPAGITSMDRLYVVDSDSVKMIAEGYCTESQSMVMRYFDGLKQLSAIVDADEFERIMVESEKHLEDER